jgi:hypothetical protein
MDSNSGTHLQSDFLISFGSLGSRAFHESLTSISGQAFRSNSFGLPSWFISSLKALKKTEIIPHTRDMLSPRNLMRTLLFSLSFQVDATMSLFSAEVDKTTPFLSSLSNVLTGLGFFSAFPFSGLFKIFNEKHPSQWLVSNRMECSMVAFRSHALKRTTAFFSNQYLPSNSLFPTILIRTLHFIPPAEQQLNAAAKSLKPISGAVAGVAIIALFSICFLLHRRHKHHQRQEQSIDELDLSTEHSHKEEEEFDDEDEDFFDLENSRERIKSRDLVDAENENWVSGRIREQGELRTDFDE